MSRVWVWHPFACPVLGFGTVSSVQFYGYILKAGSGYTGTKEGSFTIEAAANPAKITTTKTLKADNGAFDLNGLVNDAKGDVTFTCDNPQHGSYSDGKYTPSSAGDDTIKVTVAGISEGGDATLEYAEVEADIKITVVSADAIDVAVTADDFTYNKKPAAVSYDTIPDGSTISISFTGTKPDGTAHTPITASDSDLATQAPSDAGTWTVTISATGSDSKTYIGEKTFTISPADLADATVETGKTLDGVEGHAAEYTGTAIDFVPTKVMIGEAELTADTDYTVSSAEGNINAGSYEMTLSAATNQNYTGTKTVAYQIVGKAIAIASATASTRTYDGTDQIEITAVTFDPAPSPALTLGTDYTAVGTLDGAGAVGTRNVTVEVTMVNPNYRLPVATRENAGTVEITAADLSAAEFSPIPDQRYTGTPVKVEDFTVTLGDQTLVKDTDYTIAYASEDDDACTAIGTVTVTITGKGNYTGTASTSYEIADIPLTGRQISVSPESVTVEAGVSKTVTITDNAASETPVYTLTGVDTKVATAVNSGSTITITGVAAGETSVTLASAATSSYAALDPSITIPVKVTAKTVETPVVSKPAEPEVDTGSLSTSNPDLTQKDIEAVKESASTLTTETADGNDPLSEALTEQKAEVERLVESVKIEEKTAEITELKALSNVEVSGAEDVAPVVVTYMEIKVTDYKPADSKLTMEIEPQMMVVLTSKTIAAGGTTIKTSGEDQNAVKLEDTKKPVEINKPVVIKVVLPATFVQNAGAKDIFVGHTTKAGRYEYRGEKSGNNFSFTNPHGFSPFDFTTDPTSGAWIGKVGYENLSKALDEVKDGETITVSNSDTTGSTDRTDLTDKSFTVKKSDDSAWSGSVTINGTKYTADSNGKITVTKPDDSGDSGNHGGGGGGGGSSKPAIKPGEKPETPGTTAPSGGVAGFNDVATSAWYADSVQYVVDKGLFGGVGNGNFAPNANMTRAMMWTVLARYKGVDTNTGSNWYEAARAWAIAQGISDGTMADGNVTREQFVTMLWRLSGEPAVETGASFTDGGRVSAYAKTAVDWAVAQGIVNGYSDGSFKPQGSATRAEVAKMLTVFCSNSEAEG